MGRSEDGHQSLRDRLRDCSEALGDRAIELLREAMQTKDPDVRAGFAALEKRMTRARRAVEKAIGLLDGD